MHIWTQSGAAGSCGGDHITYCCAACLFSCGFLVASTAVLIGLRDYGSLGLYMSFWCRVGFWCLCVTVQQEVLLCLHLSVYRANTGAPLWAATYVCVGCSPWPGCGRWVCTYSMFVLGLPRGLFLVGHARNTSQGRRRRGIRYRCLSHLSLLHSMWSSSRAL